MSQPPVPSRSSAKTDGQFAELGRAEQDREPLGELRVEWGPVGWQTQIWDSSGDPSLTRRRRLRSGSYRSAVPPMISGNTLAIPSALLADLDDATVAVARFDAEARFRSGGVLAVLLRSESASSSQIEQITASARAIAEAEFTGFGSRNAALVTANVQAMIRALEGEGPLRAGDIEAIQATLLADNPALIGWRNDAVWIGAGGSTPLDADFVPPSHEQIPRLIDDLVTFAARDDLPIIAQAAITHAQFETIHPFSDGNGRTGRAIVHRMLRQKGLATLSTLPISAGILVWKDRYFDALTTYRTGDAGPIVALFAEAFVYAAEQGRQLGETVERIRATWGSRISARADSAIWRMLDLFASHPVGDAAYIAEGVGIRPDNAPRYLRQLEEAGVIAATRHHRAGRVLYRAPEILDALDEYAKGFGRRR